MRPHLLAGLAACLLAAPCAAQAPPTGPLSLLIPASTRAAALGNAGVTGRDDDVVFYNPAQLVNTRGGFSVTVGTYGADSRLLNVNTSFTGGPLSLGIGVQTVNFTTDQAESYPYTTDALTRSGRVNAQSSVAVIGGAMVFKGFRIGAGTKFVEDRADGVGTFTVPARGVHNAVAFDLGTSHPLWQGTAGLAVQNIGRGPGKAGARTDLPVQATLGWLRGFTVGEFDLAVTTQVTARRSWWSPAAGVELGYSWIEGYNVGARLGVRRPEDDGEKPVGLGLGFAGDRLSLEYALQFFEKGKANRLTIRWR